MVDIGWVILTMGDRNAALARACRSLMTQLEGRDELVVIQNGGEPASNKAAGAAYLHLPENIGIPAARDFGARRFGTDLVGFLDDDAELQENAAARVRREFEQDPELAVVAMRVLDEDGATTRRHVPRIGTRRATVTGPVATFLGGACVVRRSAYEQAGGYFGALFYGHEELELSWRLVDDGWKIKYLAEASVLHPRSTISRHEEGWRNTGRNRVLIARRTLPWIVAGPHTFFWLLVGSRRSPDSTCRSNFLAGWCEGWSIPVERRPIHWRTVWRLLRLGRPPIV